MKTRVRRWAVIVGVVLLAALGGLFAGFPALGMADSLVRQTQERLGIVLQVGRASFSAVRGLRLEQITATATGERLILSARIEGLLVEHQLAPTAFLSISRIAVQHPSVELTIGRRSTEVERAANPEAMVDDRPVEGDGQAGNRPPVRGSEGVAFDLIGASIDARLPTDSSSALKAIALDVSLDGVGKNRVAAPLFQGLFGSGQFRADELWLGRIRLMRPRGEVEIADGHVFISRLRFACDNSDLFLPELDIDFNSEPFSFGTSSDVFERRSDGGSPDEWQPVTSFALLNRMCS